MEATVLFNEGMRRQITKSPMDYEVFTTLSPEEGSKASKQCRLVCL